MTSRFTATLPSRALLAALGCVVALGGCKVTQPDRELSARIEFVRHHNQWAKQNIRDYAFDYQTTGFAILPKLHVEVLNGAVSRVVIKSSGTPVQPTPTTPTIESLFETAANVLENSDYDVRIEYDEDHGFPKLIVVASEVPDAGYTITADNFTLFGMLYDKE
jgi:hypothetical protein